MTGATAVYLADDSPLGDTGTPEARPAAAAQAEPALSDPDHLVCVHLLAFLLLHERCQNACASVPEPSSIQYTYKQSRAV